MSKTTSSYYDRQITIFSPEGKLFQVEYAFRAVDAANVMVVGLKGKDCAVLVGQRKVSSQVLSQDKLLDPSSLSCFYNITDKIGGAFVGLPADCRSMVYRAREKASNFQRLNAFPIPVDYLAQKIANINQIFTQHAYMRIQACMGILIGIDEERGVPAVYRFDPAGWYTGNKAAVIGSKETEAINYLEKLLKKKEELDGVEEVVVGAIGCLQSTLGVEFKASDLEAVIVTKENPYFRRVGEEEIDNYLTRVAERD